MFGRKKSPVESGPDVPDAPLRCSFCNKTQDDVRKLIAGPTVYICDECVQVCVDIIADDARFDSDTTAADGEVGVNDRPVRPILALPAGGPWFPCSLCGMPTMPGNATLIPERGVLCRACVDEVLAAAARTERET
jgi:hypothetical protein